jgi:hypothetical protein
MSVVGSYDSLTEAGRLQQSELIPGLIQEIYNQGGLWPALPVKTLDSKSLDYNREVNPTGGQFLDIGEEIASDADLTFTPISVTLKRYIKQHDLDHFILETYKNPIEMEAQAVEIITKGVQQGLEDALIYADAAANAKTFDGLHEIVEDTSGQNLHAGSGTTGAAGSLAVIAQLVDLVKPRPDALLMNFSIQNRLSSLAYGGTTSYPVVNAPTDPVSGLGKRITYWDDIPVVRSDYITMTETIASGAYALKTGGATTTIFAYRAGQTEEGGLSILMGLNAAGEMFNAIKIPHLESKDAARYRLRVYAAPALGSTKALAAYDGLTNAAFTA